MSGLIDALVLRLSAPTPRARGPVVVLSGRNEAKDETAARKEFAARFGVIPVLATGKHTAEEARMLISLVMGDVTVVTHAYHVPRAFLTILKALQQAERDRELRVWMAGVPSGWETWEVEQRKIMQYAELGDVASIQDGLSYLDWRDAD